MVEHLAVILRRIAGGQRRARTWVQHVVTDLGAVEDARIDDLMQRRVVADVWLDNSGSSEALIERAREVWDQRILPLAHNISAGEVVRAPARLAPAEKALFAGLIHAQDFSVVGAAWIEHATPPV